MGREIRRVPQDWQHPKDRHGNYRAMYDIPYRTAADEWIANFEAWRRGETPHGSLDDFLYAYSPPYAETFREREWTPEEATHYQIYETVSEGTPVSPVFATTDEMRAWLIDQGHSERAADGFIRTGWVFSALFTSSGITMGIDSYDALPDA